MMYSFLSSNNPFGELIEGLEAFSIIFNTFMSAFFICVKYVFGLILIVLGFLTIFKSRRNNNFKNPRFIANDANHNRFKKSGIVLAGIYINIGIGIIFTYFTLLLVILLEPIPDRFIFIMFTDNNVIDPNIIYNIRDIETLSEPFDKTLYYLLSIGSFLSFLDIIVNLWLILNNGGSNLRMQITLLLTGIVGCFFTGFTTFLMLFL